MPIVYRYFIESKIDKRWISQGEIKGTPGLDLPPEVIQELEKLKFKFGNQPKDLKISVLKK